MAVTGATGTIGRGLLPWLETDDGIARVVSVSSRAWDPRADGLGKVEHRRADVRDETALTEAFAGADVVVHLAFALYGARQTEAALHAINVGGTRNAVRAAAAAGARRLIYTSSAAVYGFGDERPVRVGEDAPVDPDAEHFYSRHKAEAERALLEELAAHPQLTWVVFRPCAVVGPHALGAAVHAVPPPLSRAAAALGTIAGSAGLRPVVPAPPVPVQFVHERDVGQAIAKAVPPVIPAIGWLQLLRAPLELDTARARRELGWAPEFTSITALAATRRALGL